MAVMSLRPWQVSVKVDGSWNRVGVVVDRPPVVAKTLVIAAKVQAHFARCKQKV